MTAQTTARRSLRALGLLIALCVAAPAAAQWELEIPLEEGVRRPDGGVAPSVAEESAAAWGAPPDEEAPPPPREGGAGSAAGTAAADRADAVDRDVLGAGVAADLAPAAPRPEPRRPATAPAPGDTASDGSAGEANAAAPAAQGRPGTGADRASAPARAARAPAPATPPAAKAAPKAAPQGTGASRTGGPAPRTGAGEAKGLAEGISLPRVDHRTLRDHWERRRSRLEELDRLAAESEAQAVLLAAGELGIPALPDLADAAVLEGHRDLQREDVTDALAKADLALALAPDHPAAHWFRVRALAARGFGATGDVVPAVLEALAAELGSFPHGRAVLVGLAATVLAGVSLGAIAFLLVALLRTIRHFLHDFHHLFPTGLLRLQTAVVALALLVLPLLLRLGLAVSVSVAVLAAWLYLSRRERILGAVALGLLTLAPLAGGLLAEQGTFWSTPAADVWRLERTGDWEGAATRIAARAEAGEATWEERFALARYHLREGRLDPAEALFGALVEEQPALAAAWHDLGVIRYARGDLDAAEDAFLEALEREPALAAAWHDLSKVHFRRTDLAAGREARRRARDLDPALVAAHPDDATGLNRALAQAALPDAALTALARRSARPEPAREALQARLAGVAPPALRPWLPLAVLVPALLLGLTIGRADPSRSCEKCGRSVCRRCDPEVGRGHLCGQCVNVFDRQSAVAPQARIAKERSIRRYQAWRERWSRGFGVLVPGAGHVMLGRPVTGFVLLALSGVAAAGLVAGAPLPVPLRLGVAVPLWWWATFGLLAVVTWGVGLWSLGRER